jgi:sulfite dehydrogenase (quinone) subunit SoeC
MHPAYSVIVFTTASGAGYGLLIWLSVGVALGLVPRTPLLGFIGIGLALALVTLGLLSSTAHLGRPERAWRAFSQWRTSWLSREGVAAVATFIPSGALGLGWVFGEWVPGQIIVAAWLSIACALVTLWCTGMIYASLTTIRAWHHPLVAPIYLVLALATGGILLCALLPLFGEGARWIAVLSVLALIAGWVLKARYWSSIDRAERTTTAETATGLGAFGTVRPLDPPHTQPNYVMREMGYQVARRHALKLRKLSTALLFLVPIALVLWALTPLPPFAQVALAVVAVCSAAVGVLTERWLFFAEAEHVVVLYYRGGAA